MLLEGLVSRFKSFFEKYELELLFAFAAGGLSFLKELSVESMTPISPWFLQHVSSMCSFIAYLGTICPHIGQVILAGGTLLKNEIIEEDAEGIDGVPLPSTFFVVPFFVLFLLSDKLIRDLLISEDLASAITKLQSIYMAQATSFRPCFLILYYLKEKKKRLFSALHFPSVILWHSFKKKKRKISNERASKVPNATKVNSGEKKPKTLKWKSQATLNCYNATVPLPSPEAGKQVQCNCQPSTAAGFMGML